MVAMRDGTQLAADIYLPAQDGKARSGRFPALLMRTPYNKEVRATPFARYFAARGYVVVIQDVRARYKSQGHWRPWYDDGRDGYDTAAWIGRQSWSDGGIGTVGTSYEGGTQQALAIAQAPHLKAMVPLFSVSNVTRYGIRNNGAFELRWFNWVFSMGEPGAEPSLVATAAARAATLVSESLGISVTAASAINSTIVGGVAGGLGTVATNRVTGDSSSVLYGTITGAISPLVSGEGFVAGVAQLGLKDAEAALLGSVTQGYNFAAALAYACEIIRELMQGLTHADRSSLVKVRDETRLMVFSIPFLAACA